MSLSLLTLMAAPLSALAEDLDCKALTEESLLRACNDYKRGALSLSAALALNCDGKDHDSRFCTVIAQDIRTKAIMFKVSPGRPTLNRVLVLERSGQKIFETKRESLRLHMEPGAYTVKVQANSAFEYEVKLDLEQNLNVASNLTLTLPAPPESVPQAGGLTYREHPDRDPTRVWLAPLTAKPDAPPSDTELVAGQVYKVQSEGTASLPITVKVQKADQPSDPPSIVAPPSPPQPPRAPPPSPTFLSRWGATIVGSVLTAAAGAATAVYVKHERSTASEAGTGATMQCGQSQPTQACVDATSAESYHRGRADAGILWGLGMTAAFAAGTAYVSLAY